MRVGIAIDVSTDVSHDFIVENNIFVLPSTVHMGDLHVVYDRAPDKIAEFYRNHYDSVRLQSETTALSVKEIEDLFLSKLVLEYDYIFLVTLSSTHSLTYDNAHKASFTILQSYTDVREAQNVLGPFALRVVDSQSLFAGPGLLAWEAVRLVKANTTPVEIRKRLDELAPHIYSYMVPHDLYSLRARGAQRGDDSVGWFRYTLGTAFDIKPVIRTNRSVSAPVATIRHFSSAAEKIFLHCAAQIRRGLLVPMVNISYGGDLGRLHFMPGFLALSKAAADHNVELMLSVMSPAAAINIGIGALSVAFCSKDPDEFEG
jgi:DegV family protein with EDD domain